MAFEFWRHLERFGPGRTYPQSANNKEDEGQYGRRMSVGGLRDGDAGNIEKRVENGTTTTAYSDPAQQDGLFARAKRSIFEFWKSLADAAQSPPPSPRNTPNGRNNERMRSNSRNNRDNKVNMKPGEDPQHPAEDTTKRMEPMTKPMSSTSPAAKPGLSFPPKKDIKSAIEAVWVRPVDKLPMAIDLPRLLPHLVIESRISNDNQGGDDNPPSDSDMTENDKNQADMLLDCFVRLAHLLEGCDKAEKIAKYFGDYIKGNDNQTGALAKQLQRFVSEVVGDESPITRILKTINQAMIAPAIIEIKTTLCPTLLWKDAGGWKIHILQTDKSIIVTHRKRQKQISAKPEDFFEFEWKLSIIFAADVSHIEEVSLKISDVVFQPSTSAEKRKEIESIMAPHREVSGMEDID